MKTIVMEHFNSILFRKSGPANKQSNNTINQSINQSIYVLDVCVIFFFVHFLFYVSFKIGPCILVSTGL